MLEEEKRQWTEFRNEWNRSVTSMLEEKNKEIIPLLDNIGDVLGESSLTINLSLRNSSASYYA